MNCAIVVWKSISIGNSTIHYNFVFDYYFKHCNLHGKWNRGLYLNDIDFYEVFIPENYIIKLIPLEVSCIT